MIIPMPENRGIGFTVIDESNIDLKGYLPQNVGRYSNYLFTRDNYRWPFVEKENPRYVIDAFSPNLNKELHIGHLRNLVTAKFLKRTNEGTHVSLFGASVGVYSWAEEAIWELLNFAQYKPDEVYYDILMPWDYVSRYLETGKNENNGCEVWQENPEVIVTTSQHKHTYSFYSIAFEKLQSPDYYLTGDEQADFFKSLGLGEKHLPMGLVLGLDGKKMKSRKQDKDGNVVFDPYTANEAIKDVMDNLQPTPEPKKLAWNIIAWNFLHVNRTKAIRFNPIEWVKTDSLRRRMLRHGDSPRNPLSPAVHCKSKERYRHEKVIR